MSTTVKILLGIAGFFVLCIGLVAWRGYSWWQANAVAIKASGEDGRIYGRTADNAACVKSAMDRFGTDSSTRGSVQATIYVQNCLPESKPTPGFCDGVPQPSEFTATRDWAKSKCATVTSASDRACRMTLGPVARFCHPRDKENS